jgi:Predicted sugar phosphate isomerase involved in capsule formation
VNSESSASVIDAAVEVVLREAKAVKDVARQIDNDFVEIAALLMGCTGKVIVGGVGTSGFIARRAAHIFSVSGTPSLFLHPTEGQHGSVGALRREDILIVLSKGGSSEEVNKLATLAKHEGLTVIALTSAGESELTFIADHTVVIRRDDIADPGGLIALGSTLAYAAWLDAMSVVLMRAKSYTWDQVLFTHPGGAVGKLRELPEELAGLDIPTSSTSQA